MRDVPNPSGRAEALAALSSNPRPVAVSTADGEVRSAAVADRVAALRERADGRAEPGSCPWTGWES